MLKVSPCKQRTHLMLSPFKVSDGRIILFMSHISQLETVPKTASLILIPSCFQFISLPASRCGKDEEIVRNCTSTANTECKKIQPNAISASGTRSVEAYDT